MSLELKNVYKKFDNSEKIILEDINLKIDKCEFICVLGPSGCGKSTLLNLIAGLENVTSGEILLNGKIISSPDSQRVMMFQEPALYPWLNVADNVKFGLKIAKINKDEQDFRVNKYLKMVNLSDYEHYNIHQLSGGMKQRVALARTLCMDSEIMLMDEPFSALDKQTKNILCTELENIWIETKKTIIYVTHSVEEALFFSDRIVMLSSNPGKIIKIFDVGFERPRHIDDSAFIHLRSEILKELQPYVNN